MKRFRHVPSTYLLLVLTGWILFSLSVAWVTTRDIGAFHTNQKHLINNEVTGAALSIQEFVADHQRFIEAFVEEKSELIDALYDHPLDEALRESIQRSLNRWFPSFFAFTLADKDGNDLIDDIDGFVGPACVTSIKDFLKRRRSDTSIGKHLYEPEIHPQPFNYHFDMMAPLNIGGRTHGVFFVSFHPTVIQQILKSYESPGHHIIVVNRDRANLIEVTSRGARDVIAKDRDVTLTPAEAGSILARKDIDNSRWVVVGLPAAGLFKAYDSSQWQVAIILILLSLMAAVLSLLAVERAEGRHWEARRNTEALNEVLQQEIAIKNRFFSIIGHDLKSPFTSLLGLSNVMMNMSDNLTREQLIEYAGKINSSGKRVYELLDNLLEWARFQMQKGALRPVDIDVCEITSKVCEVLQPGALEKELMIEQHPAEMAMHADPDMITLVIRNLIANAIKFTPRGGKISINTRVDGEFVEVAISDTGMGVDPKILGGIFQVDQKTTTLGIDGEVGTGLGLPLCKDMVEANGGSIWVETVAGRGTTFYFTVPAA